MSPKFKQHPPQIHSSDSHGRSKRHSASVEARVREVRLCPHGCPSGLGRLSLWIPPPLGEVG